MRLNPRISNPLFTTVVHKADVREGMDHMYGNSNTILIVIYQI